MPKKSKVNKLARMSDEERARYLQHRADLEEETRRRKRELVTRFIKNKLDKEETYARMNTAKINQEWRYILRRIKCKQMALDIQGMMMSFNFMVERKDRLLKALVKSLDDSDEQHRRAFQAHTENVSYFLSIGTQRLDKLQSEYEHQKNDLLENWERDEFDITDNQDRAEYKLLLINYIQESNFNAFKKQKEIERATAKNDARLEHEDEMRTLCKPKKLEIETYWSKLREVYTSYLEQHNPIMAHYQALREKDEFYQRDIARNDLRIRRETENLVMLQSAWLKTTGMMKNKLIRMWNKKEELAKKYWQMKRDNKSELTKDDQKLTVMVNSSQDAIKRLEEAKQKIYKVIQLADICRKYENVGDNIVFYDSENDVDSLDYEHLNRAMIDECKEYDKMDKFLLKLNRAKVQTMCLKTEKAKLSKENIQLKHYIKKYLTELALREKDRPHSVKIASGVQKLDANGKTLNRPVTCIEGALCNAVMHEKRMKTYMKKNKEASIQAYPRIQCWMQPS
ncbi:dynein regulatory complex subunit 2 [Bombyx mandarina]|uniref:Dynein regulatory complex subunit 2 n=1 Tax=Bombyx mandarina TaxID=7092 RepID=A0A6J2JP28_BOMMA|nr:dynein regulatory complex subunit 2 [Bombyx mandarina]XP_028030060.1 dynein regulatory complex subunit 2 [Bombyx mandarina]